jgi:hypothetical protein
MKMAYGKNRKVFLKTGAILHKNPREPQRIQTNGSVDHLYTIEVGGGESYHM